ncbi:MAG: hypothetical protein K2X77_10280, partial [Candidatus Obscuribacterales bacterium]|nr:hypothetical protein [Candidatus Obscuribacterales bacterium]
QHSFAPEARFKEEGTKRKLAIGANEQGATFFRSRGEIQGRRYEKKARNWSERIGSNILSLQRRDSREQEMRGRK